MTPSLLARLKERKLVQWALAYLAGAWVLLQVLHLLGETYAWPSAIMRSVPVLLAVGFLAALVLAWYHGEKGQQRVSGVELLMLSALLVLAGVAVAFIGRSGLSEGQSAATALAAPSPVVEQRSIAVLPFANLSADPEQEYFSDGLTEELLNVLAQIPELRVAARTSSFAFKGQRVPVDSVARALRVAHVLEGSVRKAGDRVRIRAQLIDASNGYHLWSQSYDRELKDVFAIQDEISRAIARALELRLAGERVTRAGRRTEDPGAHDLYLRGLHAIHALEFARAREYFEQAVARDPDFALAYASLSDAYNQLEEPEKAKAAALRALALDSTLAEAHAAVAYPLIFRDWNWPAAERALNRALQLNPGLASAAARRAYAYAAVGRMQEAIAEIERAQTLDPLSFRIEADRAIIYYMAREFDRAERQLRRVLELDPNLRGARWFLGMVLERKGLKAEAIREYEAAGDSVSAATAAGDVAAALKLLADQERTSPPPDPWSLAMHYAHLGRNDQAMQWLERAYQQRHRLIAFLAVDPTWDPLRSDPRFQALVKKVGL